MRRWLVGVVVFWAVLHQRPHTRRVGRFCFHSFECLRKPRGALAFGARPRRPAWPGWLSYLHCPREGGGERAKPLLFKCAGTKP
jgi:hypothetical protein